MFSFVDLSWFLLVLVYIITPFLTRPISWIPDWTVPQINPNTIKSYKNYLQNMQHMVLHKRPTLIIGTERLACLNSPPGVQRGTLA